MCIGICAHYCLHALITVLTYCTLNETMFLFARLYLQSVETIGGIRKKLEKKIIRRSVAHCYVYVKKDVVSLSVCGKWQLNYCPSITIIIMYHISDVNGKDKTMDIAVVIDSKALFNPSTPPGDLMGSCCNPPGWSITLSLGYPLLSHSTLSVYKIGITAGLTSICDVALLFSSAGIIFKSRQSHHADCLIGTVTQPTDSRLCETTVRVTYTMQRLQGCLFRTSKSHVLANNFFITQMGSNYTKCRNSLVPA